MIPVLVKDARMPDAAALPDDVRALTRLQALDLSHGRWNHDVGRLLSALEQRRAG